MPAYWEQVQASLEEVRAYALEKGVMLGCENREKFQELPVDADYAEFIKGLDKGRTTVVTGTIPVTPR
jgi:phage portal protein BeeE